MHLIGRLIPLSSLTATTVLALSVALCGVRVLAQVVKYYCAHWPKVGCIYYCRSITSYCSVLCSLGVLSAPMSALNLRHTDAGGASLISLSWDDCMCFAWSTPDVVHLFLTLWFCLSISRQRSRLKTCTDITRCDHVGKEIMFQRAEFNSGDRAKTYGDFAGSSLFSAKICYFFGFKSGLRSPNGFICCQ
ncbi:hypothetical protein EDB84DRAFT_526956 [Lactarius hengduanensis]|nr:hypothetical protein EDB84DRAFT_526956 [Lactarius hengduanensis]